MSIAVRTGLIALFVIVLVVGIIAGWGLLQRQMLLGQNQGLKSDLSNDESEIASLKSQTKELQDKAESLNNKITLAQQDKAQLQSQYDEVKKKSDDLQVQLDQANTDRDDWKNRVGTITRERDDLMQKLRNRPTKIIYKDRIRKVIVHDALNNAENNSAPAAVTPAPIVEVTSSQGDQYWAAVLRQKAALQIELEKEKSSLDQAALQVVELKKQNSDLELEVKRVSNEKDEIVQKIKYGQDLADNLSVDLARSRNDQKAVNDRADRLKEENLELQSQIKDLSATKLDLEKTISRLTDEKDSMQKKLVETESVIQSRIDDIWKIKEGLDKKLSENASSSSGSMELPPIIVNAPNGQQQAQAPVSAYSSSTSATGKTQGTIISINQSNNFVIVDLGQENSSVSVGNPLKVFHNSDQVATLEVIQVRRDICAADIKDKTADLRVGDVVKFY